MSPSEAVAHYGSVAAAARAQGIPRTTFRRQLAKPAPAKETHDIKFQKFAKAKASTPALIKRLASEVAAKQKADASNKWFRLTFPSAAPIGFVWFGDPHLGDKTNWPRLLADAETCATTPGLFGVNVGDASNNWVGRLVRIYGDETIGHAEERQLIRWFLAEAGVKWATWLVGNHDFWNEGEAIMRLINEASGAEVPIFAWEARLELRFPKCAPIRVHSAHDFPGHSMWNATHAPARVARMLGSDADLFACGHRHEWGIQQYEMTERDRYPLAIRARGYKVLDPYARDKGFQQSRHGCGIMTIFDPSATGPGRVLAFADVQQGARVLSALRAEHEGSRK